VIELENKFFFKPNGIAWRNVPLQNPFREKLRRQLRFNLIDLTDRATIHDSKKSIGREIASLSPRMENINEDCLHSIDGD